MERAVYANENILNQLKGLKPVLEQRFHVVQIALFGSYAIGDFNDKSDIDILVSFDQPIAWDFFDLQDFLKNQFNREIDLVSMKALKPQLKDAILKSAIFI